MASVIEKFKKMVKSVEHPEGVETDLYPVTHTSAVRYPDGTTLTAKLNIPEDGSMAGLNTTAKNIVGGINEVKGSADTANSNLDAIGSYTQEEIDAIYNAATEV